MKVDALYNPLTVVGQGHESLAEVASRMRFNDVGSAAVLEGGRVAGIITERDLARALADGVDPRTTVVAEYMTPNPVVVPPTMDAVEAAQIMANLGIRHLPVVEDGKLLGLISIRDILIELVWAPKSA